jgi:hypothetical protein
MTGIEKTGGRGNNPWVRQPNLASQFCLIHSDTIRDCRHSTIDDKGQILSLLQKDCAGPPGACIYLLALSDRSKEEKKRRKNPSRSSGSC